MKKLLLAFALLFVSSFAPPAAFAESEMPTAKPVFLSVKDKKDLARIETYLNGLKNVSADFLQVDDAGGMMRGQLAISRPGKMRATYAPPCKDFIVADGGTVHIWNEDLQSQTNVDQDASLAQFILRDPIKLYGDVTITKIARSSPKIEITLAQTADPGAGSLTLVFSDKPLKLRQWKVVDPQGHSTGVNLENISDHAAFPDDTFIFIPPSFAKD